MTILCVHNRDKKKAKDVEEQTKNWGFWKVLRSFSGWPVTAHTGHTGLNTVHCHKASSVNWTNKSTLNKLSNGQTLTVRGIFLFN